MTKLIYSWIEPIEGALLYLALLFGIGLPVVYIARLFN